VLNIICAECGTSFEVGPSRPLATYAEMHDHQRVPLCPRCADRWETDRADVRPGFGAITLLHHLTADIALAMIAEGEATAAP
jgi:hypothetical protein